MKCNPWRWIWGLVPIAMMGWVAVLGQKDSIEADLSSRVRGLLARDGLQWAAVEFTGRDGVLQGRSLEEDGAAKALRLASETWGVRIVDNRTGLVEKVDRYLWLASRDGKQVVIEGHVPDDKTRLTLLELAKSVFGDATVQDRMSLARGSPPVDAWLAGVGFALKQLGLMKRGKVELDQMALTAIGEADDTRAFASLRSSFASAVPKGVRIKQESVQAPVVRPYVWSARLAGGQLTLSGAVPNENARQTMVSIARRVLPKAKLDDRLTYGGGAPEGFTGMAELALRELGNLEEGAVEIRDLAFAISGMAESAGKADGVRQAVKRLPAIVRVNETITFRADIASPFVTRIELTEKRVALLGHVPGDEARQALLAAVAKALPDIEVQDQLQVRRGQPETWQKCIALGLDGLHRLGEGQAVLSDRKLEVTGTADTEEEMQSLVEDLRDTAGTDCVSAPRIGFTPPARPPASATPATPPAAVAGADEARRAEEEAARMRAAEEQRRQREQAQAQADAAARSRAADAEAQAKAAAAAEEERRRAAAERAREEEQRRRDEAARAVEERRRVDEEQRKQQAEADERAKTAAEERKRQLALDCQTTMRQIAQEGVILFEYAKADLNARSHETLRKIARTANQCPEFKLEVEGHTDTDGAPDRNQRLSDRRAKSVVDFLVKSGVSADRVSGVGYGEFRPVAPNDTAENKAKNRRIEFSVSTE